MFKANRFAFCISITNIILRIITEKIVTQSSYFMYDFLVHLQKTRQTQLLSLPLHLNMYYKIITYFLYSFDMQDYLDSFDLLCYLPQL